MRTFELTTRVKSVSRGKGQSAVAAAAYRAGADLRCDRTGVTHRYGRRRGVVEADILVPVGNPTPSREALWNASEAAERRKNSRVAREWLFSLPVELSPERRRAAVRRVAAHLVARHGVAVDYAIHAPVGGSDPRNHHAHLLLTTRRMEGGQLTDKTRELDDKATGAELVKDWRRITAEILNAEIAKEAAATVQVEHRSFADRGIERVPGRHRGLWKRRVWQGSLGDVFRRVARVTKCAVIHCGAMSRPAEL